MNTVYKSFIKYASFVFVFPHVYCLSHIFKERKREENDCFHTSEGYILWKALEGHLNRGRNECIQTFLLLSPS